MTKKFIQRWLPQPDADGNYPEFAYFKESLKQRELLRLTRRSVSKAVAIGIFVAFVPMPFQMLLAGGLALLFNANLIISLAGVWITNPITAPPIMYFCYKVGLWIMMRPASVFHFELSTHWLITEINRIYPPLLVGSLVVGTVLATIGYCAVLVSWRISVLRQWDHRRNKRR